MAQVYDGMECPLCSKVIDVDSDFFASTALPDEDGDLIDESDAAMHWACLFAREDADRFLDKLDAGERRSLRANPCWEILVDDAALLVAVNPDPTLDRDFGLSVHVLRTGMSWDLALNRFPACLEAMADPARLSVLPSERRARVAAALEALRAMAPQLTQELRRLDSRVK